MRKLDACNFFSFARTVSKLDNCPQACMQQSAVVNTVHE